MKSSDDCCLVVTIPERLVPCSAEVLLWNYWDGEHLIPVHGGYSYAKFLYQGDRFTLALFGTKPPFVPFSIPTIAFVVQHKDYVQLTYALQLVLLSKTRIEIEPKTRNSCVVRVSYRMILPWLFRGLYTPLARLVPRWFNTVYEEDLPLRIRRQRVIEAGFVDYKGMPCWRSDVSNKTEYRLKFPLLPAKGSDLLDHPFYSGY